MRVVLAAGPRAATNDVRLALAGRREVEVVSPLEAAVERAQAVPGAVLLAVWPAEGLGRRGVYQLLGATVPITTLAVLDPRLVDDRLALLDCGAAYLPLPFHGAELAWHLDRLDDQPGNRRRWLDDICLDEAGRTVHRGGVPLELARKEFDLLAYFMAHPRVVLSREALLEGVWGSQNYHPNAVEVAVSALRRRIEAHGDRVIHTVRGVGYICRPTGDLDQNGLVDMMARRKRLQTERDALVARREEMVRNRRHVGARENGER